MSQTNTPTEGGTLTVLYIGPASPATTQRINVLKAAGLTVHRVASGVDGLLQLEQLNPDCIVMPGDSNAIETPHVHKFVRETTPDVPVFVIGNPPATKAPGSTGLWPIQCVPDDESLGTVIQSAIKEYAVETANENHLTLVQTIKNITCESLNAADRTAIEDTIYTHLTTIDRYQFAWLGEIPSPDTVQLNTPITQSVSLDDFIKLLGGNTDQDPLTRAMESRDVVVQSTNLTTRSTATTTTGGALPSGQPVATPDRQIVVVPFVHETAVKGFLVLVVGTNTAVSTAEQRLLQDLGQITGFFIHRLETDSEGLTDLEEFASIVVHELRNPLAVARAQLQLAQDGNPERLDRVEQALIQIEHVLNNELDLLRGLGLSDRTRGELDEDATRAWKSVVTHDANLEVTNSIEFVADHSLVVRLLATLFDNAVTHGGDDVSIRVGRIDPGFFFVDSGFFVEDTGPGIPESAHEEIFDRGFSTEGGTGLGLAIVKRIVDAHEWVIKVTASARGGARFEITGVETPGDEPS